MAKLGSSQILSAADCQVLLATAIATGFLATVATAVTTHDGTPPKFFLCPVENRLSAPMKLYCEGGSKSILGPGDTEERVYESIYPWGELKRTTPTVACKWWSDGNVMDGVVVWDERWPEAPSCRWDGGDGRCRVVFEGSRREVVLVTSKGRRVLGDLAIKECSNHLGGYGGWVPFGLACTYPKHDHKYYGTIGWSIGF